VGIVFLLGRGLGPALCPPKAQLACQRLASSSLFALVNLVRDSLAARQAAGARGARL